LGIPVALHLSASGRFIVQSQAGCEPLAAATTSKGIR